MGIPRVSKFVSIFHALGYAIPIGGHSLSMVVVYTDLRWRVFPLASFGRLSGILLVVDQLHVGLEAIRTNTICFAGDCGL